MPGLADQIDNCPVVLPPLKIGNVQFCRFFPAQPATQEDSEQRSIPLAFERIRVWNLPECSGLVGGEPITKTNAELLGPLDPPDAGCKIRAEKAGGSAWRYPRRDSFEGRLSRTADFAWSRSGRFKLCFGEDLSLRLPRFMNRGLQAPAEEYVQCRRGQMPLH
jgi:hypothetical protein